MNLLMIRNRIYNWFDHQLNDFGDFSKKSWWPLILAIGMFWLIGQICLWLNQPMEIIYKLEYTPDGTQVFDPCERGQYNPVDC